jgi:hypothetical protein
MVSTPQTRHAASAADAGAGYPARTRYLPAVRIGALAAGALAAGALAVGALAIGALAIGRSRIRRLEIDELVVRRLDAGDVRVSGHLEVPSTAHTQTACGTPR